MQLYAEKNVCAYLHSPSRTNFGLSLFILIGILISYIPQHHRIIRRRSSEGISPYFVLLGSTAGTSAFANILLLDRTNVSCCRYVTGYECLAGVLGIAQVGTQWACFTVILLLYLIFFPRPPTSDTTTTTLIRHHQDQQQQPPILKTTYRTALLTTAGYTLHLILTLLLTLVLLATQPRSIPALATTLGVLAAVLTAIQYLPQLHTTYRMQAVGSLSIPMMLIQTPGSFLWAGSLAARMGWGGWSSWGIFLVSGTLQGLLLGMAVVFELRNRRDSGGGRSKKKAERLNNGIGGSTRTRQPAPGLTSMLDGGRSETDDEGGHVVEGNGERTPLLGERR